MNLHLNRVNANLRLTKTKLSLYGVMLFAGVLIAACSNGTVGSIPDTNVNLSTNLTIEKAATIPVLNGVATQTGVYIHNNTGLAINGIQYAIVNTGNNLKTTGVNSELQLGTNCTSIAANSSCLLGVTTPSLTVSQSGSTLIDASFNGVHSKQLINYRYYARNDYTGVNFSDGSTSLYGTNDYATVYAFVGQGQAQNNVGFNASNSSLGVASGLTNGSVNIAANQVIPLEIHSNQNVTSHLVTLTPYTVTNSKHSAYSLQTANQQNQILQVSISPTQQANLLISDAPVLSAIGESTATITLINNGNNPATSSVLTSADSTKIGVTTASSNPCTSGADIPAGASCNYQINLVDKYNNGSSNLNLNYNNGVAAVDTSQTVYYYSNLAAPMVSVVPDSSSFTETINASGSVVFNVHNIGNAPLNNLSVNLNKTLTQATLSQTNTCGTTLNAQASCSITVTVTANANVDAGLFYVNLKGSFTNGATTTNYSFVSKSVNTTITDAGIATITSTTPQNNATEVSGATGIILNFNKAMDPTTLNTSNILLQKVSDDSSVALNFQGVTNNNQTVTFTQASGTLSNSSEYKIVINPSAIKDYTGNTMGADPTQTVATFTTSADSVAPTLSSVDPQNSAMNQSRTPAINVNFSEPMDSSKLTTGNITLKTAAGVTVANTSIALSNNNQTATINLNGTQLAEMTGYQLVLNQLSLTDVAGNAMGSNTAYVATSFTTGDFTAPTISSTIPVNGATGAAVNTSISLTFSEAMDTSTLTTTNILLKKTSDSSEVTLNNPTFSNADKTVTFQPSTNLSVGENYTLQINPSAIMDLAGNSINPATNQTVSTFTIVSQPAITIANTTSWSTSMGSAFAINAGITNGSSTVTPTATGVNTISPASCNLDSANASSASCVFIVTNYTGVSNYYANWDPANVTNSVDVASPSIINTLSGISLNVTATNNATINGGPSPQGFSGISAQVTAPYIYLPAIMPGAESATNTGITWGAGGDIPTRFIVGKRANGTACASGQETRVDNLTGLMWPKNGIIGFEATDGGGPIAQPNYANTTPNLNHLTWVSAKAAIVNLNAAATKLCGYSDWRLPTINELRSLVNYAQSNPATWLNQVAQGFSNVPSVADVYYWSSSTFAAFPNSAWVVSFGSGYVTPYNKTNAVYVWPVRGGQ